MRSLLLSGLLVLSLLCPIAVGGHALAQDNDDSALVVPADDDDSALVAAVEDALPEVSDEEVTEAVTTLLDYQNGGWGALAAALLTLLVFLLRKTGALSKLPKQALPWVAAGIAMLGDVVAALATGTAIPDALLQGSCSVLRQSASGRWL
jgi:hypothetical protein